MKIETSNTKQHSLTFRIFGASKDSYATLTEWANGEGFDFEIESPGESKERISLHNQEADVFLALYAHRNLET